MEIKINIPENDYIQPTEVREDVVQKICDVFLDRRGGCYHNAFHPNSDGRCRTRDLGLRLYKGTNKAYEFTTSAASGEFIRIHGVEMKAAFRALVSAGYHMYRVYEYGTWMGYICDKKPYYQGGTEVREFTDFID